MKNKNEAPTMENSIDFYNFCTMENRLPIYEILLERFTRGARASISNWIRKLTNISYSTKTMKFGEWVQSKSGPQCCTITRFNNQKGPALFNMSMPLSYGILDSLLGGSGKSYDLEGKEYTSLELSILKEISDLMIGDLEMAFEPVQKIDCQFLRMEINPQFIGIVPPASKVIVTTFKMDFEGCEGEVELVVPYSTIFPMRDKLFRSFN